VLLGNRRSFFDLDTHPTSEEIESLMKTRNQKLHTCVSKYDFAGE